MKYVLARAAGRIGGCLNAVEIQNGDEPGRQGGRRDADKIDVVGMKRMGSWGRTNGLKYVKATLESKYGKRIISRGVCTRNCGAVMFSNENQRLAGIVTSGEEFLFEGSRAR